MMKISRLLLAISISAIALTEIKAQDHEWGGALLGSVYTGELTETPWRGRGTRPGLGAFYRYSFSPKFAVRVGLNFTYVAGYDQYNNDSNSTDDNEVYRWRRQLSFFTHILELHGLAEYNFLNYVPGSKRYNFTPYIFGGISLFHFTPKARVGNVVYKLRDYQTESPAKPKYSYIAPAIPIGGGIKFSVGKNRLWTVGIEAGFRIAFTDYLDDIGSRYSATTFPTDDNNITRILTLREIGNPGQGRGNPDSNDHYWTFGVTLSKTIRKNPCF